MKNLVVEAAYPLNFREEDAKKLGEHLRNRHSVDLIGIKRVGISNFLRFFLNHKDITRAYIHANEKDMFIAVDMNDLVEIDTNQFWLLTFKRIIDTLETYDIQMATKKHLNSLFIEAIKTKDLFFTIDSIRHSLNEIIKLDYLPTIFLLRFDRLKHIISSDFFSNLQGLRDGTLEKLAYVFTSFKGLNEIAPEVFEKKYLSIFSHVSYIKPAKEKDMKIIFDTFAKRYNIVPRNDLIDAIIEFSGGHVQYMHLALIILNEKVKDKNIDIEDLFNLFINDERVTTQSEEIWESLDANSKQVLHKICENEKIDEESKLKAKYLFDVGLCATSEKQINVFSPYFAHYIKQVYKNGNGKEKSIELSKKENSLFVLLLDNLNEVMERDKIISAVWPEYEELGVSDWTIDRLIARLRTKLSQQKNNYNIVTIKTRGFKMVES